MTEITTRKLFLSYHQAYLSFAVNAFKLSKSISRTGFNYFRQYEIDVVVYSFTCLQSAIEFVFYEGQHELLPITIKNNSLTHYIRRKWPKLTTADKISLLAFAWTGKPFWKTEGGYLLFCDLQKIRDGLIHSEPIEENGRLDLSKKSEITLEVK